jgi:hypothetical protein
MLLLPLFFLNKEVSNPNHCVDFTRELTGSLELFHLGFIAPYFPQLVGITAGLINYLVWMKTFTKPKTFKALISTPIIYFLFSKGAEILITKYWSYCI